MEFDQIGQNFSTRVRLEKRVELLRMCLIEGCSIKSWLLSIDSKLTLTIGTNFSKCFPNWQMQALKRAISFMDQVSTVKGLRDLMCETWKLIKKASWGQLWPDHQVLSLIDLFFRLTERMLSSQWVGQVIKMCQFIPLHIKSRLVQRELLWRVDDSLRLPSCRRLKINSLSLTSLSFRDLVIGQC